MGSIDKKTKKVLKQYGQVKKESGVWIVENEGKPSFFVEILDSNPQKTVKVSPILGQGVKPREMVPNC